MKKINTLLLLSTALLWFSHSFAETHEVSTGTQKNVLLELYTSQGCSSCPPAEEWIASTSKQSAFPEPNLIPLVFHVDYWDYLGWKDSFADPEYSVRQKRHQLNGSIRALYTPQLILNSTELRPISRMPTLFDRNRQTPALVELTLRVNTQDPVKEKWLVQLTSAPTDTVLADNQSLFFAITESNLTTDVRAGENHGRILTHDHVVREMIGPIELSLSGETTTTREIPIADEWRDENLNVVAFVQNGNGKIVQAVSLRPHGTVQ